MDVPGTARRTDLALDETTVRLARGLSARQIEVLCLAAAGLSNAEIAGRLIVEVSTVGTHLTHLSRHFGLSRRALIASARQILDEIHTCEGTGAA
jgi:ATP/maltotriose-dependent transcriptional regulator MalT